MLRSSPSALAVALLGMSIGAACDDNTKDSWDLIQGSANLIAVATPALTQVGSLLAIRGTYGTDCQYRSTLGTWSLPLNGYGGVKEGERVAVVRGDSLCNLTLTGIVAQGSSSVPQEYHVRPPFVLGTAYPPYASDCQLLSFKAAFFAMARLRSLNPQPWSNDFVIDVVYSDDPARVDLERRTEYVTVQGIAEAQGVPAPDYQSDLSGLALYMDAHGVLTAETGGAVTLSLLTQAAQDFVVTSFDPGSTQSAVDEAYRAAGQKTAISGPMVNIQAAELGIVPGNRLPISRYIILSNTMSSAPQIRSYEVFAVKIPAP